MRISKLLNPKKALLEDQREAALIVSDVLKELASMSKVDVKLAMLDEMADKMIIERGGTAINKGYHPDWAEVPFPASVCMSVNEEVCHGVPGERVLKEGDIITYDLGVKLRDGCGDAALTVAVGEITNRQIRTMRYAKKVLYDAIRTVKAGVPLSDIGKSIDANMQMYNFRTIKEFGGHHIGKEMHEAPLIHHYYRAEDEGVLLEEGAIICIEPMITPGHGRIGLAPDQWTYFVTDEQPVAMFEHMILVKEDGYEILTNHITEDE